MCYLTFCSGTDKVGEDNKHIIIIMGDDENARKQRGGRVRLWEFLKKNLKCDVICDSVFSEIIVAG